MVAQAECIRKQKEKEKKSELLSFITKLHLLFSTTTTTKRRQTDVDSNDKKW
jgi:hypothetical protein